MLLTADGWVNEPVEVVMELGSGWTLVIVRNEFLHAVRVSELSQAAPASTPDSSRPEASKDS